MNFFEHQARARRRTVWYVLLFLAATTAIVIAANAVVLTAVWAFAFELDRPVFFSDWLRTHPAPVIWTTLITLGFVAGASLYRMIRLAGGGGAIMREIGGVRVHGETGDPARQQLINVVEEMAIAAGLPVPEIYVLEDEVKFNAFAAGHSPGDAAVAVTRGALEYFTRDELQGVIAHEFSHILNGDMRLNTRLIGVLFGILAIGVVGRLLLRGSFEAGGRAAAPGVVLGVMLLVVGYAGLLFGRLIQAAVSRSRERLADASAVQFTRNPSGLGGALKKIAVRGGTLLNVRAEEVSHMLIADGRKMFDTMFATHPPIVERIRSIEPRFNAAELKRWRLEPVRVADEAVPGRARTAAPLAAAALVAAVGNPEAPALAEARTRRQNLSAGLTAAAHSYRDAVYVTLGLALSHDADTRARQIERLQPRLASDAEAAARLEAMARGIVTLEPGLRLTLSELAFPALRRRSAGELRMLMAMLDELVRWDEHITVFEYALTRLVRLQLAEAAAPRARPGPAPKLHAVRGEVQVLLSLLAQTGVGKERDARAAYDPAARRLFPMDTPAYAPPQDWPRVLDQALARLDALGPAMKQELVEALVRVAMADGGLTTSQAELLRVVCAMLHCPLPPLPTAGS